jgi:hypothetical protein
LANDVLDDASSTSQWTSTPGWFPGNPDMQTSGWHSDPPPIDGRKIVIADTDHFAPGCGDALWAWKTFLRGHHPILMDFGIIAGVNPPDPTTGGPMAFAGRGQVRRDHGTRALPVPVAEPAVPEIDPTHAKPAHLLTRLAAGRWPSAANGQARAR